MDYYLLLFLCLFKGFLKDDQVGEFFCEKGEETNEDIMVILLLNFEKFLCTIIDQLIGSNILAMLF